MIPRGGNDPVLWRHPVYNKSYQYILFGIVNIIVHHIGFWKNRRQLVLHSRRFAKQICLFIVCEDFKLIQKILHNTTSKSRFIS